MENRMEEANRSIIEEHIHNATICMVTVDIMQWSLKPEDLSRQWVDASGNVWFTIVQDEVNDKPLTEGHMEVFYSNVSESKFISLVGYAIPAGELDEMEEVYRELNIRTQDSSLRLMKFIPESAYYWDKKREDMVSLRLKKLEWDERYRFQLASSGPSRP